MMKIGIPRALIYYKMPRFWEVFFENLGFEVLLSSPTNKKIVEAGTSVADPETCFSTKVFWGHLLELKDKVDFLFLPRIKSLRKGYLSCPKFWGLPDVAQILVYSKILAPVIDLNKKSPRAITLFIAQELKKEVWKINPTPFCSKRREVNQAFEKAEVEEKAFKERQNQEYWRKIKSEKKKIVLISHPYILEDSYVNLRIKEKLAKFDLEVITIDQVPDNFLPQILHWDFGQELIEKTKKILQDCPGLLGAIEISAFQCGCDAVLKEFIEKEFRNPEGKQASYGARKKIPFLHLIIDEHTGEAGFLTRLEAFSDTLK